MEEAFTQKERTRARILDEAASAMREYGPDGIGVAALMKRAGLTHGGFYAHFENRDDLVAAAIDRMFADSAALLDHNLGDRVAREGLTLLVDDYLSPERLDALDEGCPMASLSNYATQLPSAARQRFGDGIVAFHATLERAVKALGHPDPASLASSVLSEIVGAMSLARALSDSDKARATLAATRGHVKLRLGLTAGQAMLPEGSVGAPRKRSGTHR